MVKTWHCSYQFFGVFGFEFGQLVNPSKISLIQSTNSFLVFVYGIDYKFQKTIPKSKKLFVLRIIFFEIRKWFANYPNSKPNPNTSKTENPNSDF